MDYSHFDSYAWAAYGRALDAGWSWSDALRVLTIAGYFRDQPVPEGV